MSTTFQNLCFEKCMKKAAAPNATALFSSKSTAFSPLNVYMHVYVHPLL